MLSEGGVEDIMSFHSSGVCVILMHSPDKEAQYKFRKFRKFQFIYFSFLNFKDLFIMSFAIFAANEGH